MLRSPDERSVIRDAGDRVDPDVAALHPGYGHVYTCGAARFSTFTPSRSSMISAIHCRWQWVWSRS